MLMGRRVRQNPRVVQDLVRNGHIVGNHTYYHPNLTKVPVERIRQEIQSTADTIQRTVGVRPNFFRPPYGAINEEVIREMIQEKHKIILWDVDSLDWSGLTGPQVTANVLAHAYSGSIVIMHSAGGRGESLEDTVQALPYIILTLEEMGYRFVTLPELLNLPAYEATRNG
jgi:peptidoglycan/xylan/chitin deacetylase (PgdA/CDA1 family)